MPANRRHLVGQNGTEPKIVPLNLILDYPVAWSRYKALRDLVQNFYDAVGCRAWQERFSHSLEDGVLYLRARDVGFSYDWLVPIGASTKREHRVNLRAFSARGSKSHPCARSATTTGKSRWRRVIGNCRLWSAT